MSCVCCCGFMHMGTPCSEARAVGLLQLHWRVGLHESASAKDLWCKGEARLHVAAACDGQALYILMWLNCSASVPYKGDSMLWPLIATTHFE